MEGLSLKSLLSFDTKKEKDNEQLIGNKIHIYIYNKFIYLEIISTKNSTNSSNDSSNDSFEKIILNLKEPKYSYLFCKLIKKNEEILNKLLEKNIEESSIKDLNKEEMNDKLIFLSEKEIEIIYFIFLEIKNEELDSLMITKELFSSF